MGEKKIQQDFNTTLSEWLGAKDCWISSTFSGKIIKPEYSPGYSCENIKITGARLKITSKPVLNNNTNSNLKRGLMSQ